MNWRISCTVLGIAVKVHIESVDRGTTDIGVGCVVCAKWAKLTFELSACVVKIHVDEVCWSGVSSDDVPNVSRV